MVRVILKKFEGRGYNLSLTFVHSVCELTCLHGRFWQTERVLSFRLKVMLN